jgi:hypothetical protein
MTSWTEVTDTEPRSVIRFGTLTAQGRLGELVS